MFARIDNGSGGAARAAEFDFGVRADVGVFEDVLCAAVTARCLHGDSKVALHRRAGLVMSNGGAEMVIAGDGEAVGTYKSCGHGAQQLCARTNS